jgi:hypothetical protein
MKIVAKRIPVWACDVREVKRDRVDVEVAGVDVQACRRASSRGVADRHMRRMAREFAARRTLPSCSGTCDFKASGARILELRAISPSGIVTFRIFCGLNVNADGSRDFMI